MTASKSRAVYSAWIERCKALSRYSDDLIAAFKIPRSSLPPIAR